MMRPRAFLLLACLLAATRSHAQVVPDGFAVETLARNLSLPVAIQFMPDGRLLFAEQLTGRVRVFFEGRPVQVKPVLQLRDVAVDGGERGLLGVALDPAFPARPYLYVHYTATGPNRIRISRFTLTGDLAGGFFEDLVADTLSRYDLIDDIPDQATDHNGGTVRFAADGLLYVSLGEDGQACAAQDTTQLRGKILRLKVNTLPDGPGRAFRSQVTPFDNPFVSRPDSNARLVAALGLRNPFRIQPDRVRNWLVIGDPGESTREELDVLVLRLPTPRPAQPELGADFGWPYLEGSVPGPSPGACGPTGRRGRAITTSPPSTRATCSRTTTTRARSTTWCPPATASRRGRTSPASRRRGSGGPASRASPTGRSAMTARSTSVASRPASTTPRA